MGKKGIDFVISFLVFRSKKCYDRIYQNINKFKKIIKEGIYLGNSTFRGGTHPYEGKELSMDLPIKSLLPKDELVFPMSQHIGPATPTVSVGDTVKIGQVIGRAGGFISRQYREFCIRKSYTKIEPRLTVSGAKTTCVVARKRWRISGIDGLGRTGLYALPKRRSVRSSKISGSSVWEALSFPTNVKVTPKNEDEIEYDHQRSRM